ncbi:MAG: Wzz/FepE/Etk N-terminal domain-containing protein, partial [Candidatus Microthrix parvicella]
MNALLKAYWRIPVIAVLGGLIAFGGSFVSAEKYTSTTRVLIRGREATFLTTTGVDLSDQPGVIDASMAKSLAETQSGIVTSREVATIVVDKLDLDMPKESGGFFSSM